MGILGALFGKGKGDGDGYPVGGKSGRGKGHPDGWNPSRDHAEVMRDGAPAVEGVHYEGFGLGRRGRDRIK